MNAPRQNCPGGQSCRFWRFAQRTVDDDEHGGWFVPSRAPGGVCTNAGGTKNGTVTDPSTWASSWGAPSLLTRIMTGGNMPGTLAEAHQDVAKQCSCVWATVLGDRAQVPTTGISVTTSVVATSSKRPLFRLARDGLNHCVAEIRINELLQRPSAIQARAEDYGLALVIAASFLPLHG